MNVALASEPAQKPDIAYRSPEWVDLHAGTTEGRDLNDPNAVDAAIESARLQSSEAADGNGQGVEYPAENELSVEAYRATLAARAVRIITSRITAKMNAHRPDGSSDHSYRDRYAEYISLMNLARSGESANTILCIMWDSRHKGTHALAKELTGGKNPYGTEEYPTEIDALEEMEHRTGEIYDDQPNGKWHPRDEAYARTKSRHFDPPTCDGDGSAKVA